MYGPCSRVMLEYIRSNVELADTVCWTKCFCRVFVEDSSKQHAVTCLSFFSLTPDRYRNRSPGRPTETEDPLLLKEQGQLLELNFV
ncbi:hypothetical protein WJX77_011500 [Trebouxia sp. C0004]